MLLILLDSVFMLTEDIQDKKKVVALQLLKTRAVIIFLLRIKMVVSLQYQQRITHAFQQ